MHRSHHEVIEIRAGTTMHPRVGLTVHENGNAALRPIPAEPYLVAEAHLRRIGSDALISFEASLYSVSADRVRAGVNEYKSAPAATKSPSPLSTVTHVRGAWVVDPAHWDPAHWPSVPDGHTRATTDGRSDPDTTDALVAGVLDAPSC